jgi:SRSO17 transposase
LPEGWHHWLLARRRISPPDEIAYYFVFAPATVTREDVVRAAGTRWQVEEGFELAKQEVGLDEYEVWQWQGWYRHITLAMFALAFLTVLKAQTRKKGLRWIKGKPKS